MTIHARVLPSFPASIEGADGIKVESNAGRAFVSFDPSGVPLSPDPGAADRSLLVINDTTGNAEKTSGQALIGPFIAEAEGVLDETKAAKDQARYFSEIAEGIVGFEFADPEEAKEGDAAGKLMSPYLANVLVRTAAGNFAPLERFSAAVQPGANVQAALSNAIQQTQQYGDAILLPNFPIVYGSVQETLDAPLTIVAQPKTLMLQRPQDQLEFRARWDAPIAVTSLQDVAWNDGTRVTKIGLASVLGLERGNRMQITSRDKATANATAYSESFRIAFVDLDASEVYVHGQLFDLDKYVTTPQVRRIGDGAKLIVGGPNRLRFQGIYADGRAASPNDPSVTQRGFKCIAATGLEKPEFKVEFDRCWRVGLNLLSTWMADADVKATDLPNLPSANGYGYAVVEGGASFGNRIVVHAERCRSAYTTSSTLGAFSEETVLEHGYPAYASVTGTAIDCHATSWGTHAEGYGITFHDIVDIATRKDKNLAEISNAYSFQDRSRRTTLRGLTSYQTRGAIRIDHSTEQDAVPDPNGVSIYSGIRHVGDGARINFTHSITARGPNSSCRYILDDVQGQDVDRLIWLQAGAKMEMRGLKGHNIGQSAIRMEDGAELVLSDFDIDLTTERGSAVNARMVQFVTNNVLTISDGILRGAANAQSIVRAGAGTTTTIRHAGVKADSPIPLFGGGGTPSDVPLQSIGRQVSSARGETILAPSGRVWNPFSPTVAIWENSGDAIASLVAGNANVAHLTFGRTADQNPASIRYDHSTNKFTVRANNADRLELDSAGLRYLLSSLNDLTANGQLGFERVSDTQIRLKYRGNDGTTRSTTLTLT